MFGIRLRSLFTSRWLALLWAILVLLTAFRIVGPAEDKSAEATNANGLTDAQREAIANAL